MKITILGEDGEETNRCRCVGLGLGLCSEEESYMCSEGQFEISGQDVVPITSMDTLVREVDQIYEHYTEWDDRKERILKILERADLCTNEVNRFTHWSPDKPYTRNLAHSNNNYTILILCWSPGKGDR